MQGHGGVFLVVSVTGGHDWHIVRGARDAEHPVRLRTVTRQTVFLHHRPLVVFLRSATALGVRALYQH